MKTSSYTCRLGDACDALAVVQIRDRDGSQTRGCFPHAYAALKAISGARVVWSKTRPPNEWAELALRTLDERIA